MLSIKTTAHSITVSDGENQLTVLKTDSGIEFHSKVSNIKKNRLMLELQMRIKSYILNPRDNRDNYKVRFNTLAKLFTSIEAKTLQGLQASF